MIRPPHQPVAMRDDGGLEIYEPPLTGIMMTPKTAPWPPDSPEVPKAPSTLTPMFFERPYMQYLIDEYYGTELQEHVKASHLDS